MTKAEIHKLADAAARAAAELRDALLAFDDDPSEDWQAMIDLADSAQDDLAAIAEALV